VKGKEVYLTISVKKRKMMIIIGRGGKGERVFFGSSVFAALTFWTFLRRTSQFDDDVDDEERIKQIRKNGPKFSLISITAHS